MKIGKLCNSFFGLFNKAAFDKSLMQEEVLSVERSKEDALVKQIFFENANLNSPLYIPRSKDYYKADDADAKIIAFYLPQFHAFPENDSWWGTGFTEWTNVTRAVPQYVGQYQPRLPDELGFYDLSHTDVMFKQVEMAKQYGIYGFCFHYYWFSGKRLMEKPIFNYLAEKKLELPFCLCWANEPWSRRWDGSEEDLLMPQSFSVNDIKLFYDDIKPFFLDDRYIRVDKKPVLIIYRANFFDKELIKEALGKWRKFACEDDLNGIYAICVQSFGLDGDPKEWGFDAAVEFPPHNCGQTGDVSIKTFADNFQGEVRDILPNIKRIFEEVPSYTLFRTVSPGWDNTARKMERGLSYYGLTPSVYESWLTKGINHALNYCPPSAPFVFVNAWNEWAEGAYLEPDRKYGFSYLEATRNALECTR